MHNKKTMNKEEITAEEFLRSKNLQTEYEETGEYKMYFAVDIPKVMDEFAQPLKDRIKELEGRVITDNSKVNTNLLKENEALKQQVKELSEIVSVSFKEGYEKGWREATTEACKEIAKNYQPNER
jgi:hypothetical protein